VVTAAAPLLDSSPEEEVDPLEDSLELESGPEVVEDSVLVDGVLAVFADSLAGEEPDVSDALDLSPLLSVVVAAARLELATRAGS
jgi:hypothetical protein